MTLERVEKSIDVVSIDFWQYKVEVEERSTT